MAIANNIDNSFHCAKKLSINRVQLGIAKRDASIRCGLQVQRPSGRELLLSGDTILPLGYLNLGAKAVALKRATAFGGLICSKLEERWYAFSNSE